MSAGLKTLLEAAQFLEQQEKLKLSPQPALPSILNDQRYIVHCPVASFDSSVLTSGGQYSNNNNNNNIHVTNNNSNIIISTRNTNARHTANQVSSSSSSSAPSASATFQHANGLTITSSGNSQLLATNHHNNDYKFNGVNVGSVGAGVTVVATTSPKPPTSSAAAAAAAASASINGRSSEGRMSEDPISSHHSASSNTSPNTNSNAFLLLSAGSSNSDEQLAGEQRQQQQQQQQQQHHQHSNYAIASKQMLLNGGIRMASPAAAIGSTSKAISIPPHLHQQQHCTNKSAALSASPSAFPLYSTSSSHSITRHKSAIPLTPPPMSTRKFVETHARIRSFSLSSNKISENQLLLHSGPSGSSSSTSASTSHMIVDDAHMSYAQPSGSSSNHSPPRYSGGSHYMQMMTSAQQGPSGSQVTHGPPPIGSSGRRRTISSNSNGAGTREVHNKLEKNRRAHLKECYEALKNQLQLKDEDRKKTSNLAILGEALKHVVALQKHDQDLEAQVEKLAKEKINSQKRIVSLKRELGPKYEQIFSGIFPDIELGSIPSERETTTTDTVSLSSGRGSMLYSSSSSLSSGGSNGSNTVTSPVAAGLQTALPTAISPVISKTNSNSNATTSASASVTVSVSGSATTSPISPNLLQHLKTSASTSANNSPTGSPTATLSGGGIVSVSSMPLSLTAKNISATSLTRGSPTPSTPSPSPSSSSGVSSSSSLISSSPPMNGVINGRNVTVNIPNGLKFQTSGGVTIGTIGNSTASAAAAAIMAAAPGTVTGGAANSTNAHAQSVAVTVTVPASSNASTTITATANNGYHRSAHKRKKSSSIGDDVKNHNQNNNNNNKNNNNHNHNDISAVNNKRDRDYKDSELAAKLIKVHSGLLPSEHHPHAVSAYNTKSTPSLNSLNSVGVSVGVGVGQLQLSQVVGGGSLVVSPYIATTTGPTRSQPPKLLLNGVGGGAGTTTGEIGRLPGGAELNILPINHVPNGAKTTGMPTTPAAALYHANGKLTLVSGGAATGGSNGIFLKDNTTVSVASSNAIPLHLGASTANVYAPVLMPSAANAGNLAQLIAATGSSHKPNVERLNGKLRLSVGEPAPPQTNTQYLSARKPIVVTVNSAATPNRGAIPPTKIITTTAATLAGKKMTTNNCPTFTQAYALTQTTKTSFS